MYERVTPGVCSCDRCSECVCDDRMKGCFPATVGQSHPGLLLLLESCCQSERTDEWMEGGGKKKKKKKSAASG